MIHKTDLKTYEIETIDQYFDLIIDSCINGQFSQVENQIHELSKDQKKDFIDWCNIQVDENIFEGSSYEYCAKKALELI